MAKFYSQSFIFPYPWDKVAIAVCNKNPNPYSAGVISEDVISTKIIDGKLIVTKLMMRTSKIPKWAENIVPSKIVPIIEECIIDPLNKTYITTKRNILHQKFMMAKEICNYTQDEVDINKTKCIKKAWVESKVVGLSTAIKKYGIEKYKQNALYAALGLEAVLEKMFPHIDSQTDHFGSNNLVIMQDQKISNVKSQLSSDEFLPTKNHLFPPQYLFPLLFYSALKKWFNTGLCLLNSRQLLSPGTMLLASYSYKEIQDDSQESESKSPSLVKKIHFKRLKKWLKLSTCEGEHTEGKGEPSAKTQPTKRTIVEHALDGYYS